MKMVAAEMLQFRYLWLALREWIPWLCEAVKDNLFLRVISWEVRLPCPHFHFREVVAISWELVGELAEELLGEFLGEIV